MLTLRLLPPQLRAIVQVNRDGSRCVARLERVAMGERLLRGRGLRSEGAVSSTPRCEPRPRD
jgi:hypothetical protein